MLGFHRISSYSPRFRPLSRPPLSSSGHHRNPVETPPRTLGTVGRVGSDPGTPWTRSCLSGYPSAGLPPGLEDHHTLGPPYHP